MVPRQIPPWRDASWHDDAESWIRRAASDAGCDPTGPLETVRTTARSAILRVPTAGEALFFKADHGWPPPEAEVVRELARAGQGSLPIVLAADPGRGWMLTRDFGTTRLEAIDDDDRWAEAVRLHAELQLGSVDHVPSFLRMGCRDRRGDRLYRAIERLVTETAPRLLDADERRTLAALLPEIDAACAELSSSSVPPSLVHQDLVGCNIARTAGGDWVFFDWCDTVVGHPFFAVDRLLDDCWSDERRKRRVIDAYLEPWEHHEGRGRLHELFRCCLRLRVLYEDVRWHDELAVTEPDSEHAEGLRADIASGLRLVIEHW